MRSTCASLRGRSPADSSSRPPHAEPGSNRGRAMCGKRDRNGKLVLDAQLTWRQIVVLRAYAKYLRQAGITFSQRYIERVLAVNVPVTKLLVRLFESRFDAARNAGPRS